MSNAINVSIGGKSYRLVCEPGQESRVQSVAQKYENYVRQMKEAAPSMDRDALLVMAGITMADEFVSMEQQRDTEQTSLDAFHNNLAERLESMVSGE